MFSSLSLFRDIPCPAESACQLPNCLFSHSSLPSRAASQPKIPDTNGQVAVAATKSPRASTPDQDAASRKRRRIESNESSAVPATTSSPGELTRAKPTPNARNSRSTSDKKIATAETISRAPVSARRPISPPLVRSRATPAPKAPTRHVSTPKASTKPPAPQPAAPTESLNPRHLPHPPASHTFRFTVLSHLHKELMRLNSLSMESSLPTRSLSLDELIMMALDEEEKVAHTEPLVYSNVIKHRIMAFKKMTLAAWQALVAPQAPLGDTPGKQKADSTALRRGPPDIDTGLTPKEEIQMLPHLLALEYTADISPQNGFVTAPPSAYEIKAAHAGVTASLHTETCDRCATRFQIFPGRREEDGALASGGHCIHHWGRPVMPQKDPSQPRAKGEVAEKTWTCCNQAIGQGSGCTTATTHVYKVTDPKRLAAILQFVPTPPPSCSVPAEPAIALDCEMCYTTCALSLVRLTATRFPTRECILDVLVRPQGEVLDLNSRFSGVHPEHLASAAPYDITNPSSPPSDDASAEATLRILPSPHAARDLLFRHIDSATFLLGHGLENDLAALRIVHPPSGVVDTALLFRHRRGLPFRYGLRMLTAKYLERDIQVDSVGEKGGHDSKEDARAAGDLVRWKVKERWKRMQGEGWTWVRDEQEWRLEPPREKGERRVEQAASGVAAAMKDREAAASAKEKQGT